MSNPFFNAFLKIVSTLTLATAAGVLAAGHAPRAAAGVAVGAAWLALNLTLLFRLLEIGIGGGPKAPGKRDRILLYSVLKFPVLYVAGYFLLRSGFFPALSLVAGLTVAIAAFGLAWAASPRLSSGGAA